MMKRVRMKNNIYFAVIRETRCRTKYTKEGFYDGNEYYENRTEYEPVTEDRIIQLANLERPYIVAKNICCPEIIDNFYSALKVLKHSQKVFVKDIDKLIKELDEDEIQKSR